MRSMFASTAPIGPGHGGGLVSHHELTALREMSNVVQVLSPENVHVNGHYPGNPFYWDYMASLSVAQADLAFVNGAPWNATLRACRPLRVVVDCPAHNLDESVAEFGRLGVAYPFAHMTDCSLFGLYTRFISEAAAVICPSRMSAEYLAARPGTRAAIHVIPHGVDLPETLPPLPDTFTVGYLGANGPDKGLVYLLRAWAGLQYRDATLLLAGHEPFTAPMLSRSRVEMLGRVADIQCYFARLSVYVQPSVTEGFGLPVLEAMAAGRPVVVSAGAGVSELVSDGQEGYIVPPRRPDLIADAVDALRRDPATVSRMGQAARRKAEQCSWATAREEYKRVLAG